MKKPSGLGMGLSSLIPQKAHKVTPQGKDNVFYIEVHKIRGNEKQPRQDFDEKALQELAGSIKKYGILQPILVSKIEQETDRGLNIEYEVIAGERRLRAARLAGLPHVPVIVKDNCDEDRVKLELALIENIQRQDLNAVEEAEAYVRLTSDFGLTQQQIAERVGKSREVVANTMRLLDLPSDMLQALRSGKISKTHARALLAFKADPKQQRAIYEQILIGNFAAKEVETAAKEFKEAKLNKEEHPNHERFMQLQENLAHNLGTAVIIRSGASGGSIQIKFADLEQLNKIATALLD